MFSGGDYAEVAFWLENFVTSHAKRENLRVEALVEADGPREGESYGVRLRLGEAVRPEPPLELTFREVADRRGEMAWCATLASRVRAIAREFSPVTANPVRSA